MSSRILSKPSTRWVIGLIIAATAFTATTSYFGVSRFWQAGKSNSSEPTETVPKVTKVTALGRLEPQGEVIKLSAPVSLDGDRIAQLLVKRR